MAKTHSTTSPVSVQPAGTPRRSKSDLDWTPKKPHTPRSEYRFMREYSLIWGTQQSSPFGPCNGGMGVAQ
jgi:hypothetical protein